MECLQTGYLKETNTVTKPPSDVNVICRDAVTRERNLAAAQTGFCRQICDAWIVVICNVASLFLGGGGYVLSVPPFQ